MKKILICCVLTVLLCSSCNLSVSPATAEPETPEAATEALALSSVSARDELFGLAFSPEAGINPITTASKSNQTFAPLVYEGLFQVTPDYEAEPVLCKSYTVSDDNLTYTFTLQSGVLFQSGASLTAADVVYSYTQARDRSDSQYKGRFSMVRDFTSTDDYTVVVTLSTPCESLPLLLDIPIIPRDSIDEPFPPGTGPYQYITTIHEDGEDTYLEVNGNWWKGLDMPISRFYLFSSETVEDIRNSFETSRIDLISVDPTGSAGVTYHNDYELWNYPTTIMQFVSFNADSPVFYKTAARQAVLYAIDRDKIAAEVFNGYADAAILPAAPGSYQYQYNLALAERYSYDEEKILDTLKKDDFVDYDNDGVMDFDNGTSMKSCSVDFVVNAENVYKVQAATAITEVLNRNGFDVNLRVLSYDDYHEAIKSGDFDMYYGEVKLTANFDLTALVGAHGRANYFCDSSSQLDSFLLAYLADSENSYNLYEYLLSNAVIAPVVFKQNAILTPRGLVRDIEPTCWNAFYGIEGWTISFD